MSSNYPPKRRHIIKLNKKSNNWSQKLKYNFLRIIFKYILISYHVYPDYAVLNIILQYKINIKMDSKKIKSALVSVFSKDGLEEIVRELDKRGVVIYSTGGT